MRNALVWSLCLLIRAPLSPFQSEKVVLRFGPAVGASLTYFINGQVSVGGKDFFGKDLTLNANSQGLIHFSVMNWTHDTLLAGLTSPGIQVRIQLPDETQLQTLKTLAGKSLQVVFNPNGKVMEIRNLEALAHVDILNFTIPQILRDYFPAFPSKPVEAGDQWRESRRLTVPFQGLELQVNLIIEYTLNNIVPSPAGRKALISAVYTVSISGSRDLGESMGVFEGRGLGTGYLNVLVDRGYFTEYRLQFGTDAAFVVKKGPKRLLEFPFSLSVLADINLVGNNTP